MFRGMRRSKQQISEAALPADVPVQRLDALTSPFPAGVVLLTPQKA